MPGRSQACSSGGSLNANGKAERRAAIIRLGRRIVSWRGVVVGGCRGVVVVTRAAVEIEAALSAVPVSMMIVPVAIPISVMLPAIVVGASRLQWYRCGYQRHSK